MNIDNIIGKKIKAINKDHFEGCLIEFEDGTVINLWQTHFPDGSYSDTYIEESDFKIREKDALEEKSE